MLAAGLRHYLPWNEKFIKVVDSANDWAGHVEKLLKETNGSPGLERVINGDKLRAQEHATSAAEMELEAWTNIEQWAKERKILPQTEVRHTKHKSRRWLIICLRLTLILSSMFVEFCLASLHV